MKKKTMTEKKSKENITVTRIVICKDRSIEYILTRKKVKNINLRIKFEGKEVSNHKAMPKVYVSADKYVSVKYIDDFIRRKENFINNALDKYSKNIMNIPESKKYESGESFDILGKKLRLEVIQGAEEIVSADDEYIYLTVTNIKNQKRREKLIHEWMMLLTIKTFEQICKETYKMFIKYGIEYPIIKIRCMKSRWGSCHTNKGMITLNSRLIEKPISCIEYVVLHEFAHFIHPNHSKRFYDFIAVLMPNWKVCKENLTCYTPSP